MQLSACVAHGNIDVIRGSCSNKVKTNFGRQQLLENLHGEAARSAGAAAVAQMTARGEEELLEAAFAALGAKHMIRVCSVQGRACVSRPWQRLICTAAAVQEAVDLSGVTVAPDDCYDVWGSGIISISWDIKVQELKTCLLKLLGPASDILPGTRKADISHTINKSDRAWGTVKQHKVCQRDGLHSILTGEVLATNAVKDALGGFPTARIFLVKLSSKAFPPVPAAQHQPSPSQAKLTASE
ncbi:MAG: hypothetical protein FRX49_01184 [Trebouxia sp. A1-2]|nr:MAG: hypothetical protein FRX49_01184 [Trebouxia sp. A1-2]